MVPLVDDAAMLTLRRARRSALTSALIRRSTLLKGLSG
jgi:hypothetical protein